MKMSSMVFNFVVLFLWLPLWLAPSFYMSTHCDYSFHNLCNTCLVFLALLHVFGGIVCLVLCGTKNPFLASIVIILFSHNIVASLCYVNHSIPTITILRYDYKLTLNIVFKKQSMVGTCEP